jgi:DeoR/GlpR family transcriptional regulator of sugar metabolism
MLPIERRTEILRLVRKHKAVKVNELSEQFEVTEETIRRDLDKLDKEGFLKKTYGGAVLQSLVSEDESYYDREKVNIEQKRMIASYASQLIEDGETVFIDMSSSSMEVIKSIDPSKKVTVITNSISALKELSQLSHINLIGIGGTLEKTTLSMEGPMALKSIDNYYADKTLFSVRAISRERGVMDTRDQSAEIKKRMIDNAKQSILVADASKFDRSAMVRIIGMKDIDMVITEYEMDQDWKTYFKDNEIQVINAK